MSSEAVNPFDRLPLARWTLQLDAPVSRLADAGIRRWRIVEIRKLPAAGRHARGTPNDSRGRETRGKKKGSVR